MNRIEKIKVVGFWDAYSLETKLHADVNFFIGPNGTGKTTIINLVAAALVADFATLDKNAFSSIEIALTGMRDLKNKSTIIVTKKRSDKLPIPQIEYKITSGNSQRTNTYSMDKIAEQVLLRQRELLVRNQRDIYRHYLPGLIDELSDLVQVSWLSIHRATAANRGSEDKTYESTVDRKIEQLGNDLLRYISTLSRQKDEEIRIFQESIFTSLLENRKKEEFRNTVEIVKPDEQGQYLSEIFKVLRVSASSIDGKLQAYIQSSRNIYEKISKSKQADLSQEETVELLSLWRVSDIITKWNKLQQKNVEIFSQRDKFVEILNSLFRRKTVEIGESNDFAFKSEKGNIISPFMLSSGEKQLYILLGESLLQRNRPCIYIADEPELSLHVTWQEKLVDSIRSLNETSQVVIATHSPDIVGARSDRVIQMETLVK
jgi:predicted ATPase